MWDKLRNRLNRSSARSGPSDTGPDIRWIEPDENPWKVRVLDVRPITQTMVSTSANPAQAANAVSFARDDGTEFIDQAPPNDRSIPTSLGYRRDRLLADGVLFAPRQMEHKWAIFFRASRLLFVRSWLRQVFVVAEVRQQADFVDVLSIQGTFFEQPERDALTIRILDYLIRSHALGLSFPAPLPEGFERDPREALVLLLFRQPRSLRDTL